MSGVLPDQIFLPLTAALEEEDDFVFLESGRIDAGNHRSFLFVRPECWLECHGSGDLEDFFAQAEAYRRRGYALAGWFAYEFGYLLEPVLRPLRWPSISRPLARLGVFQNPTIYDHHAERILAGDPWPGREAGDVGHRISEPVPDISREEFLDALERVQAYIGAGDTYQVNFTFRLDFEFSGSVASLYQTLRRNQSVSYGAWIRCRGEDILSFSPELFFLADETRVRVRPMKGTLARGMDVRQDRALAARLQQDLKTISENVMIVDLLRNDLGRLLHAAGGGRVEVRSLFDVEVYETLLQMTSTVEGVFRRSGRRSLAGFLRALFPCGSVTGAPKIRTMEIIRELETTPRDVYCGAIGYCLGDELCFNVPIRTLTLKQGRGRMGVGAGIVHDSDPVAEWEECLLKGRFLTRSRPEFQLIETMLWRPGSGYLLFEEHMQRLSASAEYFLFPCDERKIRQRLMECGERCSSRSKIRLLLDRQGQIEITATPLEQPRGSEPFPVMFSDERIDPQDPFFRHKTTRRQLFDREYRRARELGMYEILFRNTRGEVTEGAISTLFARLQGCLYTPPLACGLLPGTLRRNMLESGQVRERVLTEDDLRSAERLFVGNSVRGLVEVFLAGNRERAG